MIDTEMKEWMDRVEGMLVYLTRRQTIREFYSVEEFAKLVGKAAFTIRKWARLGRIDTKKKHSGRGAAQEWVFPHDELLRYQREGLLPLSRRPS